ncbi:hypothetical protein TWF694_003007 [Orbilia ellipsospora]|uniref:Retrovirus-related Pol polyprotein from transposon TNT 1-94-like beta-barrel domain-containing protein n=1 Tax=Orbilia ellipsospora TaxID=2528407 RepID=A0AAV9X1J4_9PEZI
MSQETTLYCEVCRSTSHSITVCRYLQPDSCTICHRNNHVTIDCYYKEETDPSKIHKLTACKLCHRVGHTLRNCWELLENYSKRPPGFKRFIPGHERVGISETYLDRRTIWGERPGGGGGDANIRIIAPPTVNATTTITEDEELTDAVSVSVDDGAKEAEILVDISGQIVSPLTSEGETEEPKQIFCSVGLSLLDLDDEEMANLQPVLPNTIKTLTPPKSPTPEIESSTNKAITPRSEAKVLRKEGREKPLDRNTPNEELPDHWDLRGVWAASIDYAYHISSDSNDFIHLDELVEPIIVRMRNGKSLVATHCGIIRPCVLAGDRRRYLKLVDVLYLPEFEGKVMSVGKLIERGMNVKITGEKIDFLGGSDLKARATKLRDRYVFLS